MSPSSSYADFRSMTADDLVRSARDQRALVRKMRIGIEMSKEKDSARYRREKKSIARMLTAMSEKRMEGLKSGASTPTVPPRIAAKSRAASPRSKKSPAKKSPVSPA